MMSTTVQPILAMEVDQIDQQLLANTASETGRMPAGVGLEPRRKHHHVTGRRTLSTL